MPVTATHLLTAVSTTDATSYATASITPSANKLVLASFDWAQATPGTATAGGNGLTWVAVNTVTVGARAITTFRAMGASPSASAVTFTITGGTGTPTRGGYSIAEFDSVDQTGTNGSGAVVQSAVASSGGATSLTATLAAFGSTNNATYGGFMYDWHGGVTPGTGFTELSEAESVGEGFSVQSQWRNDNDTSVDWTVGTSTALAGVAIEIKFAAAASSSNFFTFM